MKPQLPTYLASAAVLENKTGSGIKLIGWTVLRTLLIAPPMMIVGVDSRRAWLGAAFASSLMSTLVLLRLFNAGQEGLSSHKSLGAPRKRKACRSLRCTS